MISVKAGFVTIGAAVGEGYFPLYFGEWIKHRRQALDLTQEQLAKGACCSVFAIRKIEAGERRPSRQLAELLAKSLEVPPECQTIFIKSARGELSVECLRPIHRGHKSQISEESRQTPGNLPGALTPFLGREPELAALGHMLQDPQCSLITIVGTGGIGKTRLAIEAAKQFQDRFPDGIWFVPLAPLKSPISIVPAIANAVNLNFQDPTTQQAQLFRYLRAKKALLILDNAEHLLNGVGVFTDILENCRQVKLLVTSRERLSLLSEWVCEIQGLPVPTSEQVEQIEVYSSIALFLQSARRVQVDFKPNEEERRWIRNICHTMDGTPLGIELSAAWVGLLSCEEIAKEIERNLDFLAVSVRDLPERHRSMRATLDHSWKLLDDKEKIILSRMSVFHGPFRREAAEEICGANIIVLSSLRNKTLLYRTDQDYFSLHELVRKYAERKLAEDPAERARVKDRHATYYVECLSKWEEALQSSQQLDTFNKMAQVIDNLSQAWRHMVIQCRPKHGEGNQFCADLLHSALFSLSLFYEMRCRSLEAVALFKESIEYLKTVQTEFETTEANIAFNSVLGHITAYLGLHHFYILQYEKSREGLEEAIRVLENSGSRVERAQAQIMLAALDYRQGRLEKSVILHEQSREVFREAGERWWYLLSLINLARSYLSLGKLLEYEALYQETYRLIEPGDMRLELMLRIGFAYSLYLQKNYVRAENLMHDNLKLSYLFENRRVTAYTLIHLGQVALSTNRDEPAEMYLQEGVSILSELGESDDLAISLLYLGKWFFNRSNLDAAHKKFQQVIRIGHSLDTFYLVYWGLVNEARTYMLEGKTEKALEIALVIKDCSVEYKIAQDEGDRLLDDLQDALPKEQGKTIKRQVGSKISADQAEAAALVYVLDLAAG